MSRGQFRNATGDSFFAWDGDVVRFLAPLFGGDGTTSPVNHYFIDSCLRTSLLRQGPI